MKLNTFFNEENIDFHLKEINRNVLNVLQIKSMKPSGEISLPSFIY